MNFQYYVTPDQIDRAEQNGINSKVFALRIRSLGWSVEKATVTPLSKRHADLTGWREITERNGIKYQTFKKRVNIMGWTHERASTEPLQNKREAMIKVSKDRRIYPIEEIAIALTNGIVYGTYCQRRYAGWNAYDAMTIPIMTKSQIARIRK